MLSVKLLLAFVLLACMSGCGVVQFAPSEVQKENAWLLHETTKAAAGKAVEENVSEELQGLTALSVRQSESVALDYGVPDNVSGGDIESLLSDRVESIADEALYKSKGSSGLSDVLMNILIVIVSLFGGAAGTQYVSNLRKRIVGE